MMKKGKAVCAWVVVSESLFILSVDCFLAGT
jgi:hypothetical protein